MCTTEPTLSYLLTGIDPRAFFEQHWEKKALHLSGRGAEHYAPLFEPRDLNAVLWASEHPWGKVQLANHDKGANWRNYAALDPNLITLSQAYQQGDTIVLNDLQEKVEPLSVLCRSIAEVLHFRSNVNLYLTKGGKQGLSPHFDDQDVFILQLSGSKTWRLYDFIAHLPLDRNIRDERARDYGEPTDEIDLKPGDLLYLPRGFGHECRASDDAPSLHLTLSITVVRWLNLLETALQLAGETDVSLRRSIPLGGLLSRTPSKAAEVREELALMLRRCAASLSAASVEECLDFHGASLIRSLRPLADHFILEEELSLDIDTLIGRRAGAIVHCRTVGDELHVLIPGAHFVAPAGLRGVIEFIAQNDCFPVSGLPVEEGPEAKILLARDLIQQGLLIRRDHAQRP